MKATNFFYHPIFLPDFVEDSKKYLFPPLYHLHDHQLSWFFKRLFFWLIKRAYPRASQYLVYPLYFFFIILKIRFVRLNLDHFGPLMYARLFIDTEDYSRDYRYVFLYSRLPNRSLLKFLPNNFIFLKANAIAWIFSGFFFNDRLCFNIIPNFSSYSHKHKSFHAVLNHDVTRLSPLRNLNDEVQFSRLTETLGLKKPFVMIFNRETGFGYTANQSDRNNTAESFSCVIEVLVHLGYQVIRYGGLEVNNLLIERFGPSNFIDVSGTELGEEGNLVLMWRRCAFLVGNASGAIHVPSVFFRKPALYLRYPFPNNLFSWYGLDNHRGAINRSCYWHLKAAGGSVVCQYEDSESDSLMTALRCFLIDKQFATSDAFVDLPQVKDGGRRFDFATAQVDGRLRRRVYDTKNGPIFVSRHSCQLLSLHLGENPL